jgi:3-oxoadipate enol-lactonase
MVYEKWLRLLVWRAMMPTIQLKDVKLYYEDTGEKDKEAIIFSHGLLFSCRMFDAQVKALNKRYRCIAYDHRGQGQSEVTREGYDMETVYEDGVALIKALNCAPCHFVGLSMGGFAGMRIAARHPELLKSLILMETSADPEPTENVPKYKRLNFIARWLGTGLVVNPVMRILFGQKFLNDSVRVVERSLWKRRLSDVNRIGLTRAVMGVINRQSIYDEISKITTPTLIMVGDQDIATVPAKAQRIHKQIAGSTLVVIPGAGHSSSIEEPEFINNQLGLFLSSLNERLIMPQE